MEGLTKGLIAHMWKNYYEKNGRDVVMVRGKYITQHLMDVFSSILGPKMHLSFVPIACYP